MGSQLVRLMLASRKGQNIGKVPTSGLQETIATWLIVIIEAGSAFI